MSLKYFSKILFLLILFLFSPKILFSQVITVNEAVSVSARVGLDVVVESGPNGAVLLPQTAVRFGGRAYPGAQVVLLKDGKEVSSVVAGSDAYFTITLPEKAEGNTLYTLYAKDLYNNKSLFLNFPLKIKEGFLTFLDGVLFAPTIFLNKTESKFGDFVDVSGYAIPNGHLEITIKGDTEQKVFSLVSKKDGTYKIGLPLSDLAKGDYIVYINYKNDNRNSKLIKLKIGDKNLFNGENIPEIPGDCNKDSIVNLVDFSVLAFWHGKENPPICVDTNRDGIINLIDFSILAFYWTG